MLIYFVLAVMCAALVFVWQTHPSYAQDSAVSVLTLDSTAQTEEETITIASDSLELIQNGNYQDYGTPSIGSRYATSRATTVLPTTEQKNIIKNRIAHALYNVESETYGGSNLWCIVDVKDLKAKLVGMSGTEYAKSLIEEVINSNPDLFYAGSSYGAGTALVREGSNTYTIISKVLVRYSYEPSKIPVMKTKYESAMISMLSWVNPSSSDAEKAKAVHDWLVKNASYNMDAYYKGGPNGYGSWDPWTAYGAIVTKKPVCQGYSLAFMSAMNRLGIQSTFVQNAGHGWNRVRLYDTNTSGTSGYYWFNIDVCWDDSVPDKGFSAVPKTTYFLKSDAHFKTNSVGSNKEHAKWNPAGVAATNTKYDKQWNGKTYSGSATTANINSVSFNVSAITLKPETTATLNLLCSPSNVNKALASWTSSNQSIATVSSTGIVRTGSKNGNATITCKLGGKTAKCVVTVSSSATNIASASVSLSNPSYDLRYKSGVSRRPGLKVVVGGQILTSNDYSVLYPSDTVNPGIKTVTIVGKGAYTGQKKYSYTISASISQTTRTNPTNPNPTYNGKEQKRSPVIKMNGVTLKNGSDYTITYPKDVTNAGKKTVTITGKGIYKGSVTYTYTIKSANISSATVNGISTKKYTGKAIIQYPTVKMFNTTLKLNKDYKLTYKNNKNVGTATIVIVGQGNFTGSKSVTFRIAKYSGEKILSNTVINKSVAGKKSSSWYKISGRWVYKITGSNIAANGWKSISGKWYYFDGSGYAKTGWVKYSGKWYYFKSSCAMVTGWNKIGSKWYYMNSSGIMQTGWIKISGKWYYLNSDGAMQTGSKKIGNKTYKFNSSGVCLNP